MKMKHNNYLCALVTVVMLCLSSCGKDFLDTHPSDQISQKDMFTSMANVKVAMNGVYRGLYRQYDNQEQDGQAGIMIFMDYLGEDIVHSAPGTTYYRDGYKWVDHTTESGGLTTFAFKFYYKIISDVNEILGGIDGVPGAENEKNAIKGECLALRAWGHFNLVQMYGKRYIGDTSTPNDGLGVAILLKSTTEPQPRATVEEVYAQVNKDLDQAIIYLTGAPSRANKTHVDISVAKGFKARVALTMQNWAVAAEYAKEARQPFGLMSNADYLSGFNSLINTEWMWGANQLADQLPAYGSFYAYMSANFNSAHTRPNPKLINKVLYNTIPKTDIRKSLWWDGTAADAVNFPGVIVASTGLPDPAQVRNAYMHRKYLVKDPAVSVGDIPFMRSAEMYLIEAEALASMGNYTGAWEALKPLALNRDPALVKTSLTVTDVMLQRRVELWGEGFRFLDLKRTNTGLSRTTTSTDITSPTLASRAGVTSVGVDDARWQFKIPLREIQTNPYIIQNL
jgi:hypothetical protein